METLNFIFYIIDRSICDQLLTYVKWNPKKRLATYYEKYFLNSNPIFLD